MNYKFHYVKRPVTSIHFKTRLFWWFLIGLHGILKIFSQQSTLSNSSVYCGQFTSRNLQKNHFQ